MPRLFTALELPEEVEDALVDLQQPLPGARWLQSENLHITLRFAGDISRRQAEDLSEALGVIDADPFDVQVSGLDVFGGATPRTLWAGIKPSDQLASLVAAHERAARSVGLPPEGRKFKPHVTLARLNGTPVEVMARFLQRKGGLVLPPFLATRFVLFSSRPHVGGGPYVVEAAYPFRGIAHLEEDGDEDGEGHTPWLGRSRP